jgi:hypothetical protein
VTKYLAEKQFKRSNTYFSSGFQRVNPRVAWHHALGKDIMVKQVCGGDILHFLVDRKQTETGRSHYQ